MKLNKNQNVANDVLKTSDMIPKMLNDPFQGYFLAEKAERERLTFGS